jgi:membrane protease YdiL (CAAX protease family)
LDDAIDANEVAGEWSYGRVLASSLVVVLCFVVVQTAAATLVLAMRVALDPELDVEEWAANPEGDGLNISIGMFATAICCIPLVRFIVGRRQANPWEFLGVKRVSTRILLLWSLAVVPVVATLDLVAVAIGRPLVPPFMLDAYATANPILLFVAVTIAAPLIEELFFRGFLIGALQSSGSSVLMASVISSAAWAVIHLQYGLYDMSTIFLFGLLLAAARERTGSLVPCFAMHALINGIAFAETAILAGRAAV